METRGWSWVLATAVLLLMSRCADTSRCPPECHCRPVDRDWNQMYNDCSNRSMEALPVHYSHHAFKLNISFNLFTKLGETFFGKGSHALHSVFLNNNSIATIAETTFWVLPSLWELDLSGNKLEVLNQFTFKNNSQLRSLVLRGNNIKIPASAVFLEAPNLNKLDLSFNNLDALDDNAFRSMGNLRSLMLHNNRLSGVSKTWFRGLNKLRHLFLEDNNLHYLHPDTFVFTPNLMELCLSRNQLMVSSRQPFLNLQSMEILYLIGCNLTFLPGEMFRMMPRLRYLFLGNNHLRTLDHGALRSLQDLVYLNVCDNLLSCDCALKDAWQWCLYRQIKADVNCAEEGGVPLEMCAGSWSAVAELPCNVTTTTDALPPPAPAEAAAVSTESNNVGLFVGIGVAMVVLALAAIGVFYWRLSTRRPHAHRHSNHLTRRLADMLPLQNPQDDE